LVKKIEGILGLNQPIFSPSQFIPISPKLNPKTSTYAPTTYVPHMHIISLILTLHPNPPIINPILLFYECMSNVNANTGFSRNGGGDGLI
jgi:hypothetical protein